MTRTKEPSSVRVLLRIPIFRRLWAAISVSSLGDWLGLLATTALAAFLTKNSSGLVQGAAVSGVLLTRLLPDLILGPIAGALVDKIDRRKVAVIGDTLAGLLYLSIAFAGNLTWLLIGQFLVEAVGLFSGPAKSAMMVNIVPRERLAVANQLNYVSIYGMVPLAAGLFALLSTIAQFFGAATADGSAGSSALISGPTSPVAIVVALVIDAVTYFFVAATVLVSRHMIPSFVGERSDGKSILSLIKEGVSFVRHSRVMRAIYIGILGAFGAGGLTAGVAQAYVSSLGAGNAGYGILFGCVFTGLAVGMLTGPKMLPTLPRRMVFTSSIGAAGLVLITMSLLQDFLGASIAAAVMGLFAGMAWINGFTMIGHEVSDGLRGRVFAFVMSSVRLTLLGTIAAGPVIAGAVGSHVVLIGTFRWNLSGAAIVLAAGGLIALFVSGYAARQVGGVAGGLVRRVMRHRRPESLIDEFEHPGVLLAVEGADLREVARYSTALEVELRNQGFQVVTRNVADRLPVRGSGPDSVGSAGDEITGGQAAVLRAGADLAELVADRVRPDLMAGLVVLTCGFVDELVVRYGVQSGMGEERVLRMAQWAVGGLRPDLTVLVDPPPSLHAAAPVGDPLVVMDSSPGTSTDVGRGIDGAGGMTGVSDDRSADELPPDPVHAFRDRASAAPEGYLVVPPLPAGDAPLSREVVDRIGSVLRSRSPRRSVPDLAVQRGASRSGVPAQNAVASGERTERVVPAFQSAPVAIPDERPVGDEQYRCRSVELG